MGCQKPIHVGNIGSAELRFFAPADGRRQFPWVSVDDLHECLALPRDLRHELKRKLRDSRFREDTRTVAAADGIVVLVPHHMAQGLIGAMQYVGQASEVLMEQYATQGAAALKVLTGGLAAHGVLAYLKAAWDECGQEGRAS